MSDNTYLIDEIKKLKNWKWDREIADYFKISRQSITNWRMNKRVPKYLESLVGELKSELNDRPNFDITTLKGEPTMNEIIELARENGRLTEKLKQIESQPVKDDYNDFETGIWHSTCKVHVKVEGPLKGLKLLKSIESVTGKKQCTKYLGYSSSELEKIWDIGNYHGLKKHPVEKLVSNTSMVSFRTAENCIKHLCSLGFNIFTGKPIPLSFIISYIHKDGSTVNTMLSAQLTVHGTTATLIIKTRFGIEDG